MDIQAAARTLWSRYKGAAWFVGVGVTEGSSPEAIVLYVSKSPSAEVQAMHEWQGFPLSIVQSGESVAFRTRQKVSPRPGFCGAH